MEIWEILNPGRLDTHPIHFHLVNVHPEPGRLRCRKLRGWSTRARGEQRPRAHRTGLKETVQMHPGEVTRVIMKFDVPSIPGVTVPQSPRFPGYYEYVWHCHILEHEEHDMMRPLLVKA